ncbi:MAG: MFS transporter [Eubacterium sp.]|nr:MFS transporter [Eubacterium sp.]
MFSKKWVLAYIAILSTSFAVMYTSVFQVINYDIYQAFPNCPEGVSFFISSPYLVIMAASFFCPVIYRKTDRKKALLAASVIFTLGAISFTQQKTIGGFIVVNLICALTSAYINVAAVTLIAELYTDEDRRAWYMGWYNSAIAMAGSLFSVGAGYFAKAGWTAAFNVYWAAALMTLFVALFIPGGRGEQQAKDEGSKVKRAYKGYGLRFWIMAVNYVILGITYFVPGFFLSVYIAEYQLGDAFYAGVALSLDTLSGAICALFFDRIYKKLGSYTASAAFVLMGAAIFALYTLPNAAVLVLAVALMGASYMISMTYVYQESAELLPQEMVPGAMGIIVGVQYIATFLATYITRGLMAVMHTKYLTPILIFPALWILAAAAVEYMSVKKSKQGEV